MAFAYRGVTLSSGWRRRAVWTVGTLAAALVLSASALAATMSRARAAGTASAAAGGPTRVAIPLPSQGDVSYALAVVKITHPSASLAHGGIFRARIGGLGVRASSSGWREASKTTRVYVAVSRTTGASSNRVVAMFVVRRTGGSKATGAVDFTFPGARAVTGSFYDHGTSKSGFLKAFTVRNALATAIANWSRYRAALVLAHALQAALHPLLTGDVALASPARATSAATLPATGGERPDALTKAMFNLLVATIHNPSAFSAVKRSALVTGFITQELHNSTLAARWKAIVSKLPSAMVPDSYAAAAREEARYDAPHGRHALRITHNRVTIAQAGNAASYLDSNTPPPYPIEELDIRTSGPVVEANGVEIFCSPGEDSVPLSQQTPQPGDSDSVCAADFFVTSPAEQVTLVSRTGPTSWSGCTPSSDGTTCVLTIDQPNKVVNIFVGPWLTVTETGTGTVTSSPAGINCPGTCSAPFAQGTIVTLTETPGSGSTFQSWSGCVFCVQSSDDTTISTIVNQPQTVGVTWSQPLLYVLVHGSGTVTSSPPGINCSSGTCSAPFAPGTSVTLTAAPSPGQLFSGFELSSGLAAEPCQSQDPLTCTISIGDGNAAAIANFGSGETLTVAVTGGQGTVTSTPAGIDCVQGLNVASGTCSADFAQGSTVSLTATPDFGFTFGAWGPGCQVDPSGTNCSVTMNGPATQSLSFTPESTISTAILGTGTVTSSPAGIDCSSVTEFAPPIGTCSAPFPPGTTVTLSATPSGDNDLASWETGCTSTSNGNPGICTLTAPTSGNQQTDVIFQ